MPERSEFQPDWSSPPGATIADILSNRSMSAANLAKQLSKTQAFVKDLTAGKISIDPQLAAELEHALGVSRAFWLKREAQYRTDRANSDRLAESRRERDWVRTLPLKQMQEFGWLARASSDDAKVANCLRFFDVENLQEWHDRYRDYMSVAAFRTSPTYPSDPIATVAWLRQAERQANELSCRRWNRDKFSNSLAEMKKLSRRRLLRQFVPELVQMCAENGVALVIVRAPKGCRASGATKFLSAHKAMIVLSFRFRSDDHFWFTFFHEAAHLILHEQKAMFLEDDSDTTSREEAEANAFAADVLVPASYADNLQQLSRDPHEIVKLANKLGISRGVLVGQMQHRGLIGHDRLNSLKRRYDWSDISSSTAE